MNKKIALLSALLCALAQCAQDVTPWLEIKPSYFFFSASPMKNIYDDGGFEIQGSISVPFRYYLDLYGSIGYRKAWGHALNTCQKTSLTVVPIDIGLKPVFNFCERFYYFFAIGPRFFYFHQHNNSSYVDRIINRGGIGLFVNTGCNVLLADCLLLGIFGEYSYEKKKIYPNKPNVFSNGNVQLGGFAFGISLGYAF
ncbi:MAG: hypothetical protein WC707_06215 [Candidatus Babeliaceae bacterium]|jgi:hypothetical protein